MPGDRSASATTFSTVVREGPWMWSAEMQASIRRWRWRWRMREPPPLAVCSANAVEARWLDTLLTAPLAAPAAGRSIDVPERSLSRTIPRWHIRSAHHETDRASGPLAHHSAAADLPARILSHSVRLRVQNQLRRDRGARAALYRRHLLHARAPPAAHPDPRQLPLPAHRPGVRGRLPVLAAHRVLLDSDLPGPRLPHGLRHRAQPAVRAGAAAAHHHAAVLDIVPAARVRARGHHPRYRLSQHGPAVPRTDQSPLAHHAHQPRRVPRHHLLLSALHGAAAVRH